MTRPAGAAKGSGQQDANDGDPDASVDDDHIVLDYGHEANERDWRAVTATVKAYFAAAASGNGAKICSLMYSLYAEDLGETWTTASGPSGAQPESCATIMSKQSLARHADLAAKSAALTVTGVRVEGSIALALIHARSTPELLHIKLHRDHGGWGIYDMFDKGLP